MIKVNTILVKEKIKFTFKIHVQINNGFSGEGMTN